MPKLGLGLSLAHRGPLLSAISAFPIDADFSTYALGTLNGQNSWARIGTTNTASPIQVIAAAGAVPQSIRITGLSSAAQSYRDLPTASRFNPTTVTEATTFYYVLDNFKVIEAQNSTTSTGQGIVALTGTVGGVSPNSARLFLRRFGGVTANTTTFDLGVSASGATPVYGTTALAVGTLYKIVVAYTANPGLANDVVKVYVDPVGSDPTTWSYEVEQTAATDPTVSFKSFQITPGAISNSTKTDLTIGRILVGSSDVLAATPILAPVCLDETANLTMTGGTNRAYLRNSEWNGKPRYGVDVGDRVEYSGNLWYHAGLGVEYAIANNGNEAYPWLATWPTGTTATKICSGCTDLEARVWIYGVNGAWNFGPRTLTRVADRHYTFGDEVIIHNGTAWEYYYERVDTGKVSIETVTGDQAWPWLVPWVAFTAQKLCLPPFYPTYSGGVVYSIGDRVSHGGGNYVCIYNAGSLGYGPFGGYLDGTGPANGIIYWLSE